MNDYENYHYSNTLSVVVTYTSYDELETPPKRNEGRGEAARTHQRDTLECNRCAQRRCVTDPSHRWE
jgi:hypothetical protein